MIIAEIGQNHCGHMNLAKTLIRFAKNNGADLVKFQLYDSEKLYGEKQKSELSKEQALMLFNYGKEVGIEVFFSVFDIEGVKWCEEMGVKRYKIAHSMKDTETLKAIRETNKPILMSIGHLHNHIPVTRLSPQTIFLICIPQYPTPYKDLQFSEIYFDEWVQGFSDHTIGLHASMIALARGAQIIEKHFAIDHKTGVDAQWSMTPQELKELKRFENSVKETLG